MSSARRYLLARTVNTRRSARFEFRKPVNRKKSLRDHRGANAR